MNKRNGKLLGILMFVTLAKCQEVVVEDIVWPQGYIKLPQWGGNYEPNSKHRWNLMGSIFGKDKLITLIIDYAMVEGYKKRNCNHDWFAIYNESDIQNMGEVCAPENRMLSSLGVYCNHHIPQDIITVKGQNLVIEFCSDSIIEDAGFQIKWVTTSTPPPILPPKPEPEPPVVQCGGSLTIENNNELFLVSPGFDEGHYPHNAYCKWEIRGAATAFLLDAVHFELEEEINNKCLTDYVTINVQHEADKKSLGAYCGKRGPEIAFLPNNSYVVTIEFHSNEDISWTGFKFRIRAQYPKPNVCGKVIYLDFNEMRRFTFYSPNYPAFDYGSQSCEMKLINPYPSTSKVFAITFHNLWIDGQAGQFQVVHYEDLTKHGRTFRGRIENLQTYLVTESATSQLTLVYNGSQDQVGQKMYAEIELIPRERSRCPYNYIPCRNDGCVLEEDVCNGNFDCRDQSDETVEICNYTSTYSVKNCGNQTHKPNIAAQPARLHEIVQAKPNTWPWLAVIEEKGRNSSVNLCVGTLVSSQWLITTASCMERNSNADSYVVRFGVNSYGDRENTTAKIKSMFAHPFYSRMEKNATVAMNDIMLIQLDKKMATNDVVDLACVPPSQFNLQDNEYCVTSGWAPDSPDELMQEVVMTVSRETCDKEYPHSGGFQSILCTVADLGSDKCHFINGSPLLRQNYKGLWMLQGMLQTCQPGRPNVYTRISNLKAFIYATIIKQDS